MSFLNQAGLGTHNVYGPRKSRAPKGGINTGTGSVQELTVDVWGAGINEVGLADYNKVLLPKGCLVLDGFAHVSEAFALGGTTPVIAFGTSGSEATNGVKLSKAQAEAVGVVKLVPAGTWATALAADTEVKFALGGTNPTSEDKGKVRITIRYVKLGINADAGAAAPGQGS